MGDQIWRRLGGLSFKDSNQCMDENYLRLKTGELALFHLSHPMSSRLGEYGITVCGDTGPPSGTAIQPVTAPEHRCGIRQATAVPSVRLNSH